MFLTETLSLPFYYRYVDVACNENQILPGIIAKSILFRVNRVGRFVHYIKADVSHRTLLEAIQKL